MNSAENQQPDSLPNETMPMNAEQHQEIPITNIELSPNFEEQINETNVQIKIYSEGAEKDLGEIIRVRTALGLAADDMESYPSVDAQKEEARKLQEKRYEVESQRAESANEEEKQRRIKELAEQIYDKKILAYREEKEHVYSATEHVNEQYDNGTVAHEGSPEEDIFAKMKAEALAEAIQAVEQEISEENNKTEKKKKLDKETTEEQTGQALEINDTEGVVGSSSQETLSATTEAK